MVAASSVHFLILLRSIFLFFNIKNTEANPNANKLRVRALSPQTITTPHCSVIRTVPYPAELQLFYSYSVEFKNAFSLSDIERAIATTVALQLDMCDVRGRPVYKVKRITGHSFSHSGKSSPFR